MNPYLEYTDPNFRLSCLLLDKNCCISPMEIMDKLNTEANAEARPIWKPMHMQPLYAENDFTFVEDSPVNEEIFAYGLCLPSDIKMTKEEQERIIDIIHNCFKGN